MEPDSSEPLEGVEPDAVTAEDVDEEELRAALQSADLMVRQRGVNVLEALAAEDPDDVRPYVSELGAVMDHENGPVTMAAIEALKPLAESDPEAVEDALGDMAAVLRSQLVDVQLLAGDVFARIVVDRPDLCRPYGDRMVDGLVATEPDMETTDYGEFVDDQQIAQSMQEHDQTERRRLISSRRVLANVVVAVAEEHPEALLDSVDGLTELLEDPDAGVVAGAVDALREVAMVDRDAVAPAGEELIACLDHADTSVRARAIRAVGELGLDAAVPKLEDIAENDDNEDVREIASETAEFLESIEAE